MRLLGGKNVAQQTVAMVTMTVVRVQMSVLLLRSVQVYSVFTKEVKSVETTAVLRESFAVLTQMDKTYV